jgi:LacI family transcriptional regulator
VREVATAADEHLPDSRPVTITDVARVAGVSVGTVSKAVNGRGQLRTETRQKVLAAVERLGYQANPLARSLPSGRSYSVGLITGDNFGRFSIPVLLGAEDALGAGEISVFLCDSRDDPIREQHYVRTLLARRVDGFLVTSRLTGPRPPLVGVGAVPVVYAMSSCTDPRSCAVVPDDVGGGRLAVEHLLAAGRRRIAHVTGPAHHRSATARREGALAALADAGSAPAATGICHGAWSEYWGRQAARRLLGCDPVPDAVFCGSDQIARGLVEGLQAGGVRVPEDVAVIGYDDWDVMATGRRPLLSTVDPNTNTLGRRAAQHLLAAIEGEPFHGIDLVPPNLVVRDTTD